MRCMKITGVCGLISKEKDVLKPHTLYTKGGALHCEAGISEAQCISLHAGGCTFHDGFTLHFSKGNITNFSKASFNSELSP